MILVDTSVWVEHLRRGVPRLEGLLLGSEALCHPFIAGELACGSLRNRGEILGLLNELPRVTIASHEEVLSLVERHRLWGKGLGWIDAHLLASALISSVGLWTLDAPLATAAEKLRTDGRE